MIDDLFFFSVWAARAVVFTLVVSYLCLWSFSRLLGSHIPSSGMVHAGYAWCVLDGIHWSGSWTSGAGIMEADDRRVTSFHSPTVIPLSALDKPSIMKHYHHRRTTRWGVTARSPTTVTLHDTWFVECRWWNDGWTVKTVVIWWSSASMILAPGSVESVWWNMGVHKLVRSWRCLPEVLGMVASADQTADMSPIPLANEVSMAEHLEILLNLCQFGCGTSLHLPLLPLPLLHPSDLWWEVNGYPRCSVSVSLAHVLIAAERKVDEISVTLSTPQQLPLCHTKRD